MERLQPYLAGAVTALVGFTSSFTVVLAGLRAVGASERQAASGLLAVSVIMGLLAIVAGLRYRMPISIAWSTPGAALLVATGMPRGGFGTAIAAFGICGALTAVTGLVAPLRRLVLAIPKPVANGLLAGVLLELCLVPVTTMVHRPGLTIPIVTTWLLLMRFARRWAVPAAMAVALVEIVSASGHASLVGHTLTPSLAVGSPAMSVQAATLGVSLFIVTMAAQNVPGIAVLDGFGYRPPVRQALVGTGIATVVGAPLGGHVVNLAAISAALCAGPDAHPDRGRRWIASAFAGACYVAFGLSAGLLSALVAIAPSGLVETVAGLALLTTLGAALAVVTGSDRPAVAGADRSAVANAVRPALTGGDRSAAVAGADRSAAVAGGGRAVGDVGHREAALLTFLVTASGVTVAGISSAFWGLMAGLLAVAVLAPAGGWRRTFGVSRVDGGVSETSSEERREYATESGD